jgi:putative nucleotidyltransferase with HDIG domain
MISEKMLDRWRSWFRLYTAEYMRGDVRTYETLALKYDHTMRVCAEMLELGRSLGLDGHGLRMAEAIALFHDLGRFEQFQLFNTFMDGRSVNHARAGVDVLGRYKILKDLDDEEREIIVHAISHHNARVVPPSKYERGAVYSRMIRDADKLDIYRIVIDNCRETEKSRNSAIDLDLPLLGAVSENVVDQVLKGTLVTMSHVRSVADFKLLQVSWVFDINFTHSFRRLRERDCLGTILASLEGIGLMDEIRARVCRQLELGCAGGVQGDPPRPE